MMYNVGELVWVRRDRPLAPSRWQIREVLATNPRGYPTHTCPLGNPAQEKPNETNILEYQNIGSFEDMPSNEQRAARTFHELAEYPFTEQDKKKIKATLVELGENPKYLE